LHHNQKQKTMPIFNLDNQDERNEYAMSDADKKRMAEFVDEFMDCIYLSGSKDDGKYILTLSQAEAAAKDLFLKKVL
jgi:hypothetical protein